jgi:hypothetical protein
MSRTIRDANLIKTKALPAAAATAYTASIDFVATTLYPTNELVQANVSIPATAALVEAKTITLGFQDSADDSSFANIAGTGTLVITGGTGGAGGAGNMTINLPPATRRYVRAYATVLTGGGDNTAVSFTFELLL